MEAANKNAALQWLGKAKVALQEGKTEEAERLASKSLKLCPTEYTKGGYSRRCHGFLLLGSKYMGLDSTNSRSTM